MSNSQHPIPNPGDSVRYRTANGRILEATVIAYQFGSVVLSRNGSILTRQRSELV